MDVIVAAILALAAASPSPQPDPAAAPLDAPTSANNFNQQLVDGTVVDNGCTDDDKKQLAIGMGILLQRNISMPQPRALYITSFLPEAVHRCPVTIVALGQTAGLYFAYPALPAPSAPITPASTGAPEPPGPPPLPAGVHVVGGKLQLPDYGGHRQERLNVRIYDCAIRYRAQLTRFVNALSATQYVALQSDLVQRQRFAEGLTYLSVVRAA